MVYIGDFLLLWRLASHPSHALGAIPINHTQGLAIPIGMFQLVIHKDDIALMGAVEQLAKLQRQADALFAGQATALALIAFHHIQQVIATRQPFQTEVRSPLVAQAGVKLLPKGG
jgi:hypothetical protein